MLYYIKKRVEKDAGALSLGALAQCLHVCIYCPLEPVHSLYLYYNHCHARDIKR